MTKKKNGPNASSPYWYFQPYGLKKDTFRAFLQESGITTYLTMLLSDLYDSHRKPPYPIHYFRKNFVTLDTSTPNLEFLFELLIDKRKELEKLYKENAYLKSVLADYDDQLSLEQMQFKPMKVKKKDPFDSYLSLSDLSTPTELICSEPSLEEQKKERGFMDKGGKVCVKKKLKKGGMVQSKIAASTSKAPKPLRPCLSVSSTSSEVEGLTFGICGTIEEMLRDQDHAQTLYDTDPEDDEEEYVDGENNEEE